MSRLMRDVSGETYVLNPDTLSSTMTRLLEPLTRKVSASTGVWDLVTDPVLWLGLFSFVDPVGQLVRCGRVAKSESLLPLVNAQQAS